MSNYKDDISQIGKYLEGKLDAQAMHQLESEAQDDPFLMEAMEGYETIGKDQQANLAGLKEQLAIHVAPKKERGIILWRVLPIAALLLLGIGYWLFKPVPPVKQYANVITINKAVKQPSANTQPAEIAAVPPIFPAGHKNKVIVKEYPIAPATHQDDLIAAAIIPEAKEKIVYKTDTVEYKASPYTIRANTSVDELLKRMEGVQVGADGSITSQGRQVTKVRINGKDFAGGNVQAATKNLPADIVEKVQVIDDYGDQASKTGVKSGEPTKMLNIKTDTNKRRLTAMNMLAKTPDQLKEVSIISGKNDSIALPQRIAVGYAGATPVTKNGGVNICNENLKFKKKFFDNIAIAEKYTFRQPISAKRFLKALHFISKYAPVSFDEVEQFQIGYPDLKTFQSDKANWLKWYDANKCSNLK